MYSREQMIQKQKEYLNKENPLFPRPDREQAKLELGIIAAAGEQAPQLITRIDTVFVEHGVPVQAFETARVDLPGITREFSARRDDLVHQVAIAAEANAEGLDYDPAKTIMPVIIGGINPFVVRTREDVVEGPKGFLVPNIEDGEGNIGRSQCIVVTGEMLAEGYGLGMLVADCPVENVVVTEKGNPKKLIAIAQTHNGWRQIADGSDVELQKIFAAEGWLDRDQFDIYITPSSGVAFGFEMDKEFVGEQLKARGTDVAGRDRTRDMMWGVGPDDVAHPENSDLAHMHAADTEGKAFANMAATAHINHMVSLGLDSNRAAYSSDWKDSLTSADRPSDRRAQMRYIDNPEIQKEHRTYRMLVALTPEV